MLKIHSIILCLFCYIMITGNTTAQEVTVVSWGGAYTRSQIEAYHKPFTAQTGVKINSVNYNGDLGEIEASFEADNVSWDVVNMELSDAIRACDEGLLEEIDLSILPPGADGVEASEDFLEGTLFECGVGNAVYSTIFAYDASKVIIGPKTMADFFNLEKYPGKRGMRRHPKANLEFALIADGVPANGVYEVLSTSEGIERAFRKLDTIKSEIVWWEAGSQPPQLLADGEVVMSTAYNGSIFNATAEMGKSYEIVWDGQVWDIDLWVIPKNAKNKKEAIDFLSFSTATEQLAAQASYIPYGPVRKSSIPLIGSFQNASIDMSPQMPTAPSNLTNAVQSDSKFWTDHGDLLTHRFNTWISEEQNKYSLDTCLDKNTCSIMPVFFGTNRNQIDNKNRIMFGKEDARRVQLGMATVAIPKSRKRGKPIPDVSFSEKLVAFIGYFFGRDIDTDPTKGFSIPNDGVMIISDKQDFLRAVGKFRSINQYHKDHSFVFIHGFNTSFDNAAFRTAQLAYDLGVSGFSFGTPFFFSWPSVGSPDGYMTDSQNARYAEDELNEFLELVVNKTGSKYVHIIAHSMGNYVFLEMLDNAKFNWGDAKKFNEVILAAPDIDAQRLVELSPSLSEKAENFTLFASNMDSALGWSKFLRRGKPRAGDVSADGPLMTKEIETIDVSILGLESFHVFAGAHSNYATTIDLVDDIARIFQHRDHPPHERKRSYIPTKKSNGIYWTLEK